MDRIELAAKIVAYADEKGFGSDPTPVGVTGLSLVRQRRATPIYPVVYQPVFCLVLQGAKETYLGEETVRFAAGQSLLVGLDLPTRARVVSASTAEPYVALALEIDMGLVRELAADLPPRPDGRSARGMESGAADAGITDAMRRLFELHAMPEARPVLEPLIRREVHFWLLSVRHGGLLAELAERDSRANRVARAIAAIRKDFARVLRVEDLARLSGMSVSAFHASFRDLTGTTPLQFQKQLRLMEARRLLQGDGLSVSGAAFQVGYESPTQFSREYSRQFGVTPRADKRAELAAPTF